MSNPTLAHVVHRMPGRARLRVVGRRHDKAYFRAVRERLNSADAVHHVEVNDKTGSILFRFDPDYPFESLVALADDLFTLFQPVAKGSLIGLFLDFYSKLSKSIGAASQDRLRLFELFFALTVILSLVQIWRGKILPPAFTLLQIAFAIAQAVQWQAFQSKMNELVAGYEG